LRVEDEGGVVVDLRSMMRSMMMGGKVRTAEMMRRMVVVVVPVLEVWG
jgi:hypothetical protein